MTLCAVCDWPLTSETGPLCYTCTRDGLDRQAESLIESVLRREVLEPASTGIERKRS